MVSSGLGVLRSINERSVLTQLMHHGPLTSLDLEARAGLSKPAVARLLTRLHKSDLIERAGTRPSPAGPPAQLWDVRRSAGVVAGVDIQDERIDVLIVDLRGNQLARHTEPVAARVSDPREVLIRGLGAACAAARIDLDELDDIVLGLPGIIDPASGHVISSDRLPSWEGLDVASEMGKALRHESVHVENDVNLVALAEQIQGVGRGVESALLLWIGAGIRVAIYRDGELIKSKRGAVGEVAAAVVPDPTPLKRFATSGGPFEALLRPEGLLELAKHYGLDAAADALAPLRRIVEDYDGATDSARSMITDFADCIAVGLSSPVGLLDPDVVVLAGPTSVAGGERLASIVNDRLCALTGRSPAVRTSGLGDEAIVLGAVEYGLRIARERIYVAGTNGIPT